MNKSRVFIVGIFISIFIFSFFSCSKKKQTLSKDGREILYYTCGMHPQTRVSVEEYNKGKTKDPICGMDLVPVYKEKKEETGKMKHDMVMVKLSEREKELAGVQVEEISKREVFKEIITVGRIAYDPELVVAEEEFLTALDAYNEIKKSHIEESILRAKRLLDEAEYKLKLLGLNEKLIDNLKNRKKAHTNLILPEETVWVYADVYEYEIPWISDGSMIFVESEAYPGVRFNGKIASIDPIVNPKTRTIRIRSEIENSGLKLKPGMYVKVFIRSSMKKNVLAVPKEAVLDTGVRKLVYVDRGSMGYEQREVVLGPEGVFILNGKRRKCFPVRDGLKEGEKVVVKANFLIDSQSQLTGSQAGAYGGALDKGEKEMPSGHRH